MKLPKIKADRPGGAPQDNWTPEQLLAYLRNQYTLLTARDRKIRYAVGATDDDIAEIAADIAGLEKQIAQKIARSN